jgi:GT2 family glycosyltransferase
MDRATVIITTKNRKSELRRAISSALQQTARPRILVMDDASSDGTALMVTQEFPSVRLERSHHSVGYIRQRNRAAEIANTPILISVDDDACFSTEYVVEQTLADFDHPRVAAVAIPFIDVNRSSSIRQKAPAPQPIYATYTYIGTAHALRRDLFLGLAGYREILTHQMEEEDLCVRLLEAGYITRCGRSDPIYHFESPTRSWTRMDYYGARNKVLYAWHNVPLPFVIGHLPVTTAMTLCFAWRPDRVLTRFRGVLDAYLLCLRRRAKRSPVACSTYRLSRWLKKCEAVSLDEIERWLPDTVSSPSPSSCDHDCIPHFGD